MPRSKFVFSGLLLFIAFAMQAEVQMSNIFSNNMVLQQKCDVPIWGTALPGEKVTVIFNGQERSIVAAASGKWEVKLNPMPAGGPFKLTVKGNNSLEFNNVMIGEVWLCGGQSNMQWPVRNSLNPEREIANAKYPDIRLFYVPRQMNNVPQNNVEAKWETCSPETVAEFSATAYFFGREIHRDQHVAVGLINASWDSTRIEPWTPPCGFRSVPELKGISNLVDLKEPNSPEHLQLVKDTTDRYEQWLESVKKSSSPETLLANPPSCPEGLLPYPNFQSPTVLYNAMINPFVPYALRGAIWYQGCANRGDAMLYFHKMKALINGWRTVFRNENMPFYFAQLAPNDYGHNAEALPEIWEAQTAAAAAIPNIGMAVTMDVGDIKDIHPKNKQAVGYRLALHALNKTYGKKDVVCESPVFDKVEFKDNKAIVSFKNAVELKTRNGKQPDWFTACGADGVFKPANAVIEKNKVILTVDGVDKLSAVRYAWDQLAVPNLMNEVSLPAVAFRTDAASVKQAEPANMLAMIDEAKDYKLVLGMNPVLPMMAGAVEMAYPTDNRKEITRPISKIAYYLELTNSNGKTDYVFVSMDPFTQDVNKIGVPALMSNVKFQRKITNMIVKSNVAGIRNGVFPDGGYIEFWGTNYGQSNMADVPGASPEVYDFGDMPAPGGDYGSMQIHNYLTKQTLFAYNNWKSARAADLGIGNATVGSEKDWTFLQNAGQYTRGRLLILVKTK